MSQLPTASASPTTLYRLFGKSGTLLYVGVAGNPGRRFEQHRADKPWWGEVARVELEHFPSRLDALSSELKAIKTERPVHNVLGRGSGKGTETVLTTGDRQDRLSTAVRRELISESLVGSFFHTRANPGQQGCVIAEPALGTFLVELFGWLAGESTHQELVRIEDMNGWQFYDDSKWMINAFEYGLKQQWKYERESTKTNEVIP